MERLWGGDGRTASGQGRAAEGSRWVAAGGGEPERGLGGVSDVFYHNPKFPECAFFEFGTGSFEHKPMLSGSESYSCRHTVAVYGSCYEAPQVNYALWGLLFRLCSQVPELPGHESFTEVNALLLVRGWKFHEYKQWEHGTGDLYVRQALEFTRYGYSRTAPSGAAASRACEVDLNKRACQSSFDWALVGIKNWPREQHQPPCASIQPQ